jgi:hypothetical protein
MGPETSPVTCMRGAWASGRETNGLFMWRARFAKSV